MRQYDPSLWTIPTAGRKPTAQQIEDFMIAKIKARAVRPGECIPSHRVLAKLNNVNRNTSLRAYTKLITTGWLDHSHGGRAKVPHVLPGETNMSNSTQGPFTKLPIPIATNKVMLPNIVGRKPVDFIEIGLPILKKNVTSKKNGRRYSSKSFQHEASNLGRNSVLDVIYRHILTNGFCLQENNLSLIRGRAECLSGIFSTLADEGCTIINTAPQDRLVCSILSSLPIKVVQLGTSKDTILTDVNIQLARNKINAIYLRPNGSYPTCETIDEATRLALVQMAIKFQFYIIEEDDDHELWWGTLPKRPLAQLEHSGHVIYCGALSRLSPYMRHLRIVVAPVQMICAINENISIRSGFRDTDEEREVVHMLQSNEIVSLSRHLRLSKMKDLKILNDILRLQLGNFINYQLPEHGTAIWITFNKKLDISQAIEIIKTQGHPIWTSIKEQKQILPSYHMRVDLSRFDEKECRKVAIKLRSILLSGTI